MIIKKIELKEKEFIFYVGINQLKINPSTLNFSHMFNTIKQFQDNNNELFIQVFNNLYVLNTYHILNACYFSQKAFFNNVNISNKKSIEFLLYLAANRQIKIAMEDFGVNKDQFKKGLVNLCISSSENNINFVNREIKKLLNAEKLEFTLDNYSLKKYKIIKTYFKISDNQIRSILNSYGFKLDFDRVNDKNLSKLYIALNDLICEKMSLLNLEKVPIH